MVNTRKKNKNKVSKNKVSKHKIKSNKKNKTHIKRKTNLINTKKNKLSFCGGDGEKKYKSITGEVMRLVYMEKPNFIFRDLKNFFKTRSPNYFIKHYPDKWEMIQKLWFFNKNKSLIKDGLDSLEKGVYYLNYVYHYQAKVRGILYDLKNLIEKRIKLIFNTIVTEDELLFEKANQKKSQTYENSVSSKLKGGNPVELNPYNIILHYGTSQGISGPSNADLEDLKDEEDSLGLFEKLAETFKKFSKKLFYSFNPKNAFKGGILRYETDKLYFKIVHKYKLLKHTLKHLASSQQKLYIYYLNSIYFNDVIIKYIKISDSDIKELESLNEKKANKYKQIIKLKPVFNSINEYTNNFKHDYKEIVNMYEKSINGFWIQDENGRIIFNFYKTKDEVNTEKKIKQIMKDIKIDNYLDQITSNIMGQIYLNISKKNLEFVNKTQPQQTFLEVRTIAQERFCYSRIMVQYFIWNMLLKSQGFDINIGEMIKDPTNPNAITINQDVFNQNKAEYNTSLIAKMLLADDNLEDKNNRIEWKDDLEGLKSYIAFATIFGYYDNDLINMGIPKHFVLQQIDKAKDKLNSSLIPDILKMMPKKIRGGGIEEDKQNIIIELQRLEYQLKSMKIKNLLYKSDRTYLLTYTRYKELKAIADRMKIRIPGKHNNTYKPLEVMKLSNNPNNKVIPVRQTISITTSELKDGKPVIMEEQMGWFDIWRRNFLQNFRVFCRLIDSYMNYSFNRDAEKIQPDVYFLFYRDEILKQFVRAFTGCGMLDTLYLIFHTHISEKTLYENRGELSNPETSFGNKLGYICMASQISYLYPLLFDSNYDVNLLDEHFQVRLAIANNYIDHIFKNYDEDNQESSDTIMYNYVHYIKNIETHKNSFIQFTTDLPNKSDSKDLLHIFGNIFGTSLNILEKANVLNTAKINLSTFDLSILLKKSNLLSVTPKNKAYNTDNNSGSRSTFSDLNSMNSSLSL